MKPLLYVYITFLFLLSYHVYKAQSIVLKPAHTIKTSNSIKQFLYAHNIVRARYRVPPLGWSSRLARYAKWYANQRRKDCALIHSSAHIYGENIFWGIGKKWKPSDAVGAWASEEPYYNYKTNSCSQGTDCGHFTQLVWRNTKEVGCAMLKCLNGATFVVCEYNPHGNIIGKWPY